MQNTIGQRVHGRGFYDLVETINLMLLFLYRKLGFGSPKIRTVILQLVNTSIFRTKGVVEDFLVQVGSLIFL